MVDFAQMLKDYERSKQMAKFDNEEVDEFAMSDSGMVDKDNDVSEFEDLPLNADQAAEDLASITPPPGDWVKEDTWKVTLRYREEDSQPGDLNKKGRLMISAGGLLKARVKDGIEHTPFVTVFMSPDKRQHREKPEMFDHAYKLYTQACKVYFVEMGRKVEKLGDLVAFLENDMFVLNTMLGDSGLFVMNVKAVQKRREE